MDDPYHPADELPVESFGDTVLRSRLQYLKPPFELEDCYTVTAFELPHLLGYPHSRCQKPDQLVVDGVNPVPQLLEVIHEP